MNPKKVQTLHDGITIPPVEPERSRQRDPYRVRKLVCRVVLLGAPLLVALLVLDFLFLPNGGGRYSSAAAWRDLVLLGQRSSVRNGTYSTSMGAAWPIWHVEAWKDKDGWHAWTSGDPGNPQMTAVGTPVVGWAQGGSVTIYLNVPDTRVGLWAAASEINEQLWAMDPVSMSVNPRTLPKEGVDAIRAAFVRAGGEEAGRAFDTSPVVTFPGPAFGGRSLTPDGLIHNLLSLALAALTLACLALWFPAARQHRRLTRGLCLRCGYELRGVTLTLCPECSLWFSRTPTYPGGEDGPVADAPG